MSIRNYYVPVKYFRSITLQVMYCCAWVSSFSTGVTTEIFLCLKMCRSGNGRVGWSLCLLFSWCEDDWDCCACGFAFGTGEQDFVCLVQFVWRHVFLVQHFMIKCHSCDCCSAIWILWTSWNTWLCCSWIDMSQWTFVFLEAVQWSTIQLRWSHIFCVVVHILLVLGLPISNFHAL